MVGFYAGSFDPFTNGHLQIVKKSAKCFDEVIVGIAYNTEKAVRVDKEKMLEAIKKTVEKENLTNVKVVLYKGLTMDEAKKDGADILIRGLRNGTDYEYEENMSTLNERVSGFDTCYFRAGQLGYLSSSFVMEMYNNNRPIDEYVPEEIAKLLYSLK